jgi:hypothetical protein
VLNVRRSGSSSSSQLCTPPSSATRASAAEASHQPSLDRALSYDTPPINRGDPQFRMIRERWSSALREAYQGIPRPSWD